MFTQGKFMGYYWGIGAFLSKNPERGIPGGFFVNGETNSIWVWDYLNHIWIDSNRVEGVLQGMVDDPATFEPNPKQGIKTTYLYVNHNAGTVVFTNFLNSGVPVTVTTEATAVVMLFWNGDYWETSVIPFYVDISAKADKDLGNVERSAIEDKLGGKPALLDDSGKVDRSYIPYGNTEDSVFRGDWGQDLKDNKADKDLSNVEDNIIAEKAGVSGKADKNLSNVSEDDATAKVGIFTLNGSNDFKALTYKISDKTYRAIGIDENGTPVVGVGLNGLDGSFDVKDIAYADLSNVSDEDMVKVLYGPDYDSSAEFFREFITTVPEALKVANKSDIDNITYPGSYIVIDKQIRKDSYLLLMVDRVVNSVGAQRVYTQKLFGDPDNEILVRKRINNDAWDEWSNPLALADLSNVPAIKAITVSEIDNATDNNCVYLVKDNHYMYNTRYIMTVTRADTGSIWIVQTRLCTSGVEQRKKNITTGGDWEKWVSFNDSYLLTDLSNSEKIKADTQYTILGDNRVAYGLIKSSIMGSDNTVTAENAIVQGDNNTVNHANCTIIGNNITTFANDAVYRNDSIELMHQEFIDRGDGAERGIIILVGVGLPIAVYVEGYIEESSVTSKKIVFKQVIIPDNTIQWAYVQPETPTLSFSLSNGNLIATGTAGIDYDLTLKITIIK